jgi:acyl transferase domain-containing protein
VSWVPGTFLCSYHKIFLLQGDIKSCPLQLGAVKSRLGHSETGAGALGMLHASLQLVDAASSFITHLRLPNAYISNVLEGRKVPIQLPRQAAPSMHNTESSEEVQIMGISSFAFQVCF